MKSKLFIILFLVCSCSVKKGTAQDIPKPITEFDIVCEGLDLSDKRKKKIYNRIVKMTKKYSNEKKVNFNKVKLDSLQNIAFKRYLSKEEYKQYQDKENLILEVGAKSMKNTPKLDETQNTTIQNGMNKKIENNLKHYYPKIQKLRQKFDKEIEEEDKIEIQNLREYYAKSIDEKERKLKSLYKYLDEEEKTKRLEIVDLLITQYRYFISKEHFHILGRDDEEFKERGVKLIEKYSPKMKEYEIEAYKVWKEYQEEILKNNVEDKPTEEQKLYLGLSFLLREIK